MRSHRDTYNRVEQNDQQLKIFQAILLKRISLQFEEHCHFLFQFRAIKVQHQSYENLK